MIIDTHCHFDMMASPEGYIRDAEEKSNIIIGMTNLPSYYNIGRHHVKAYRHIRLALGFHPQLASEEKCELQLFDKLIDTTSYIGEIGLDFSTMHSNSKDIQIDCLRHILSKLYDNKRKIISVHSRKAERQLFELLKEYKIHNVIFHWYTGPVALIKEIAAFGYYFSVNEAMTKSENGRKILSSIPKDRILTESDAPYNKKCNIVNTLKYLDMQEECVYDNFRRLINRIR